MPASPRVPENAALAVRFLGGLQVRQNGQLLPRPFPLRKSASLFAFLLLHPFVEHRRDFLADTFWPEARGDHALNDVAQALVSIRRLLEPEPAQRGQVLVSPRDMLRFIPPPNCWVDVWAFRDARAQAQDLVPGSSEWFALLEQTVALYTGKLLPDCLDDWCLPLQEELQNQFLTYLHDLTQAEVQRRRYHQACEWARRALGVDPCDETSHRSLMRLYYWMGEQAKALHQYRICRQALQEELDEPPSQETIALYEQIRRGRPTPGPPAPGPDPNPIPDPTVLMGPLVGRDRELQRLRAGWNRAKSGRGELILLTGEAGIGKSRLGGQLLQEVGLDCGLGLAGQASALESSFLYQPLIDPLRRALELAAQHQLTLPPSAWMGQVARLLPELQPGDGGPTAAEGESPRLLEEGIAQLMMTLAEQRPLCLFLDDLQWADKATGQLLHYLAHQTRTARVLLIGAYREGEVVGSEWLRRWLTEVEAQRMATSLPLARLNEGEVAGLLQQLAEDQASETLLRPLAERLHKETEGNPLFLLETVRDLFDRGYLTRNEEGRWRIASEKLAQSGTASSTGKTEESIPLAWLLPIPETVQRVVRQRVSRLCEEDRQLLQCAAVIGRRFTFPELQRAVGWPMEPTMQGVERLMTADLITARAHPVALDFTHDKIREVVYGDMVSIRRQELHRRVAGALEAVYGITGMSVIEDEPYPTWSRRPSPPPARARAEEHAEELARHFHEAVPLMGPERAVCYYYLAGSWARALCAYEQAVGNLLAAKSLLMRDELPPDASRLAQLGHIVEQLAPAYRSSFQRDLAQQLLRDYMDLCEQRGYGRGIARGCTLMGLFLELNPALAKAITSETMYERAIAVCEAHGLHDWIAYPRSLLAWRLVYTGVDVDRAEALVRSSLPLAEASQDKRLLLSLYTTRMWVATARADWEDLKEAFRNSLDYGGLAQVHLHMLLTKMEGSYYQLGMESAFHQLCRDIAEAYTRKGMASPVQQWYLAPTTPRVRPGALVMREEFDGEGWHPRLVWHDVTGRSRIERAIRPGWLGLYPALDADLWPEINLAAPRLLTPVAGDFVAQTRVDLGASRDVYAGLLLWQDEQHFVRLEMHRVPGQEQRAGIDLSACVGGRFRSVGRGQSERRPIWLRMERMGEWLHGLCSADGEHWLACGSVLIEPGKEESVGLLAHTQFPGDQAWFDSFRLWLGLRE